MKIGIKLEYLLIKSHYSDYYTIIKLRYDL